MHVMSNEMKNGTVKITVGLVVYNGAAHIRNALDSIVKQSYKNIELIVVDGGSNDGTLNVLEEYAEHISMLVSEPDKGIYDAMNKVCTLATGDWLIFLGCDDVLLDTLGNISKIMTDHDDVYYGDVIWRSNGRIYGGEFSKYRLMRTNFCHQSIFYPKSVYKNYSYNLNYKWLADYAYNIKLAGLGIPFKYAREVVSVYNDKGGSSRGDAVFDKDVFRLLRASFGNAYALFGMLLRSVDKVISVIVVVLKYLLPASYFEYLRTLRRRM